MGNLVAEPPLLREEGSALAHKLCQKNKKVQPCCIARRTPLLTEEGWPRHQEDVAKPPLTERTGWWSTTKRVGVLHHPEGVNEFKTGRNHGDTKDTEEGRKQQI